MAAKFFESGGMHLDTSHKKSNSILKGIRCSNLKDLYGKCVKTPTDKTATIQTPNILVFIPFNKRSVIKVIFQP